ncbi:MAG: hypothetical protein R3B51_08860 [Thermodesulfobacteriota bacterium]
MRRRRDARGHYRLGRQRARRLRYGTTRELLIGMKAVRADGTIFNGGAKVVKNVAGYDLPKLFVGSLGTLPASSSRRRSGSTPSRNSRGRASRGSARSKTRRRLCTRYLTRTS